MSYSIELRECAVGYVRGGGGLAEAARLFWVSRTTLYRWLGAPDLHPKPTKERRRKLDKVALAAHVRDFPEALLRATGGAFWRDDQGDPGGAEKIGHHQKKTDPVW